MFNKIFAVCLLVNDFEKSLSFYRDSLDLKVNSKDKGFANFKLDGTSLAIFQKNGAEAMFPKKYMKVGGGAVIGFQVNNVNKTCKSLESKGVKIFEGPKKTEWGQTVAYFRDPDDNVWEVSNK